MKVLKLVNGINRMVDVQYYDETLQVTTEIGIAGIGYDETHSIFTLPNAETYNGTTAELKVYIGGVAAIEGIEFDYQNSEVATTITTTVAIPIDGNVRFVKLS